MTVDRLREFLRLIAVGYLCGVWWPDTWGGGLAVFVVGYFIVDDLLDRPSLDRPKSPGGTP